MNILIEKVESTEKDILRNLYSFYLHDLSRYTDDLQLNDQGFFEFDSFDMIWEKEGFVPLFIKINDELAGFILMLTKPFVKKVDVCINDFFVLNKYRGKGITEKIVGTLFETYQGDYYVEQIEKNIPAVRFWKKIYQNFNITFEEKTEMHGDDVCIGQFFKIS